MTGCFKSVGFVLLLIAAACIWVLIKIKGSSDGPGALFFWIGAVGGLWGAYIVFSSIRSDK